MSNIVAIVFRILNFIVLIGVGIFLFRRYVLPGLKADYNKDKAFKKSLAEQKRLLEERSYELDMRYAQQTIKGDYLKERVIQWQESIAHKKQMRAQEKEQRLYQLTQIYKKQYEHIEKDAIKKQVVPQAFDRACSLLVHEYAQTSAGQQALSSLIQQVQEKSL